MIGFPGCVIRLALNADGLWPIDQAAIKGDSYAESLCRLFGHLVPRTILAASRAFIERYYKQPYPRQ